MPGSGGNFTFEPRRPRKEEPYRIKGEDDPLYNKSWKTTANARKTASDIETERYFDQISKEAAGFRKKAYKNMMKSTKKGKTQQVPKGPKF